MQDLAEKPFTGISAAAFCQILRTHLSGQTADLFRLGHTGMIFPQPCHRVRIVGKTFLIGKRVAVRVHRHRRTARSIHAQTNDLIGGKSLYFLPGVGEHLPDRHCRAL